MNNLASGYQAAGKLDKALPLFEETLALRKSKLGPDHPDTLASMNNLAAAYWSMKRLDKSVPLFETVLTLQEKKLGRDHPDTLMTVANLGVNYKDAGRLAEAIPLLEEAYQAAKKHPRLRWVGGQLLDAYAKAGENAKLADLLQEQLAEARKTLPKDSPELAGLLAQIGLASCNRRNGPRPNRSSASAWPSARRRSPMSGPPSTRSRCSAAPCWARRNTPKPNRCLLTGYEGMKQREKTIPPQASVRIPEALDRLIELATATNKPDDVKKWQAERAKYPDAAPTPGEKK